MKSAKKNVRDAVLVAAMDLVQVRGAYQLTLEAVARRAKVSKGGLLHHFRTKEALMQGMIAKLTTEFAEDARDPVAQIREKDARAYLARSVAGLGSRNRSAMTLLAVAAHQPKLLQPIRDYFQTRTADIMRHGKQPIETLAVMLMADGLWLFDALGIPPFTGAIREKVGKCVLTWANGNKPGKKIVQRSRAR